jgi:hypothetical protein
MTEAQSHYLRERGYNPACWEAPDQWTLVPVPNEGQCTATCVQRCQLPAGHPGQHQCSYFSLGGNLNEVMWADA